MSAKSPHMGTRGICLVEFIVLTAILFTVTMAALSVLGDSILDIWNDLVEEVGKLDQQIADVDLDIYLPESNEDTITSPEGIYIVY